MDRHRSRALCSRSSRPSRADPRRARECPPSATPRSLGSWSRAPVRARGVGLSPRQLLLQHDSSIATAPREEAQRSSVPRGTEDSSMKICGAPRPGPSMNNARWRSELRFRVGHVLVVDADLRSASSHWVREGAASCGPAALATARASLGSGDPDKHVTLYRVLDRGKPSRRVVSSTWRHRCGRELRLSKAIRHRHDLLRDHYSSSDTLFYNIIFDEYYTALTCALRDRATWGAEISLTAALRRSWRTMAILDEE
jgi:hypothetical protein